MSVTMSRVVSALTLLAAVACVSAGNSYSNTDSFGVVRLGSVPAGEGCESETFLGGASEVEISWSNMTIAADSLSIKLCFTDERISERPWRKYVDEIDKNKQCWQGLTLVHISAQLEQCLTHKNTLHTPTPPNTLLTRAYTTPTRTPYPMQSAQVELKSGRV